MPSLPVHVSVQGNLVFPDFPLPMPLLTLHKVQPPPPAPTIPVAPCFEAPVPVMWAPGFGMQQNKLTTTVYHKAQWIMLDGHDCGYMIPHVTVPAANLLLPIQIAFSSRKTLFASSKVKANGTPIACSQLLPVPIPMMACAEPISFPTASPYMNVLNSVTVGMTWHDALSGFIGMACTMVGEFLIFKYFRTNVFESSFDKLTSTVIGKLLGASNLPQFLIKTGFGIVAGGAKILLTGEGTIQIRVGSAYGQAQVSYARKDGANVWGAGGQVAPIPGVPATVSVAYQHTSKPDGSTSDKTTEVAATPVGQVSHQSSTDRDPSGSVTKESTSTTESGGAATPLGTAEGTHTSGTVDRPGHAPTTNESASGGAAGPFGAGGQVWGGPL
jgi:hypothetical protein